MGSLFPFRIAEEFENEFSHIGIKPEMLDQTGYLINFLVFYRNTKGAYTRSYKSNSTFLTKLRLIGSAYVYTIIQIEFNFIYVLVRGGGGGGGCV